MTQSATPKPVIPPLKTGSTLPWGVESEYGRLEHVLLCAPDYMRWDPNDNAVTRLMAATNKVRFEIEKAKDQHRALVAALQEAKVTAHFLEADPAAPDQTFTRDACFMTPWGAVIALMNLQTRRGEFATALEFFINHGIPVWKFVTHGTVEGGDIQIVQPGKLMIGYSEGRTSKGGARQVASWFKAAGWDVRLVYFPEHFLHIDVLFCMLAEGAAVVCTEVLGTDFVRDVKADYGLHTIIDVTYGEAMALGANGCALGEGRVLMAQHATSDKISQRLRAAGLTVTELDLSMFVLDGGGPHCLTMPLKRGPVGDAAAKRLAESAGAIGLAADFILS